MQGKSNKKAKKKKTWWAGSKQFCTRHTYKTNPKILLSHILSSCIFTIFKDLLNLFLQTPVKNVMAEGQTTGVDFRTSVAQRKPNIISSWREHSSLTFKTNNIFKNLLILLLFVCVHTTEFHKVYLQQQGAERAVSFILEASSPSSNIYTYNKQTQMWGFVCFFFLFFFFVC